MANVELLALPDELLALVARKIRYHVYLCRFFQCCSRTLATTAQREDLNITLYLSQERHISMLVPSAWSARFVRLKSVHVEPLSLSGAARLIPHLRSWPLLEELSLGVDAEDYRLTEDGNQDGADIMECVDDLAEAFRTGLVRLPALRHLSVTGCMGEDHFSGPDTTILAALTPSAQMWWMAERAQHVRCRMLSRWRELAETSDLQWQSGDYTILSWLSSQVCFQHHSQRGYKEVYKVLLEHGASEKKMASPPNYFEGPPLAPRDIYQRMMADETITQSREPHRIDDDDEWTSDESNEEDDD